MLKATSIKLMHGIMTWYVTGTTEEGETVDAVLAEGATPGDFWWEDVDEETGRRLTLPHI